MNNRILALDLATTTGFYDGKEFGSIKFPKETRATAFWDWLRAKVYVDKENQYDIIVIENAIGQRAQALEVFHELKTVVKLVSQMSDIPIIGYSPNSVKKVFAGHGHASKDDIAEKCIQKGIDVPYDIITRGKNKGKKRYDYDIADAIAIYYTHLESIK